MFSVLYATENVVARLGPFDYEEEAKTAFRHSVASGAISVRHGPAYLLTTDHRMIELDGSGVLMKIRCVVAARDAGGTPSFFPTTVETTQFRYDCGEHYDKAMKKAREAGYEPELVYDENDGPAFLFSACFPKETTKEG